MPQAGPACDMMGWTPVRVRWRDGRAAVEWYRLGEVRFSEPFFAETVARCRSEAREGIPRRETTLDELAEAHRLRPGLHPAGFVFHMSRCGSTLAAQLLASLPGAIVLSEAAPIDGILRAHLRDPSISQGQRIEWLRAMISVLGRPALPADQHYFIKFDAWNTMELPLIQRAFPGVPWIFVYRDPLEVMVSHARMRGSHVVPGVIEAEVFGLEPGAPVTSLDHYGALVLARICGAAADAITAGGRGLAVNYRELPDAVWTRLPAFFGFPCGGAEFERMKAASGLHAKHPGQIFAPDSASKRREASGDLQRLVGEILGPSFARLETLPVQNHPVRQP